MSKKGYLLQRHMDCFIDDDIRWMKDFGCISIIMESFCDERERPKFKEAIMTLGCGDEFVVAQCSHVFRDLTDMSIFLSLCHRQNIRFISIRDRIDTAEQLFSSTSAMDVLKIFYTFPEEVRQLRFDNTAVIHEEARAKERQFRHPETKKEKEALVLNMYSDGYSLQDIWFVTGFKRPCDIYRILERHHVKPNRKEKKKDKQLQHPVIPAHLLEETTISA